MFRVILILLPLLLPSYVIRLRFGPFPTTLLEIFILLSLLLWTYQCGLKGWKNTLRELEKKGWLWPALAWILAGLIGVFVAPDKFAALGLWRAYFLEPVLVFAMLRDLVRDETEKYWLLRSLIITTIAIAAITIYQSLTGLGIPVPWNAPPQGIRATGPFPFPNAVALFVVPVAALCFYLGLNSPDACKAIRIHPLWPWLGFVAGAVATFLAKSDGGLIAIAAAALTALLLKKKTRLTTLIFATLAIAAVFINPVTREKVLFKDWSGKVRLVMWQETRAMLKEHPVFGVGLGAFPDVIVRYHTAKWMEIFQYPHNIVLNLWSEVGLFGLFVFGWIFALWYKKGGRLALPVIVALLIHGLVDVPYFKNDLAVMFWLLILLTSRGL